MVTSLYGEVSGISPEWFRWYLRGRTCSPFLLSTCSVVGVLTGSQKGRQSGQDNDTTKHVMKCSHMTMTAVQWNAPHFCDRVSYLLCCRAL